MKYLRFFYAEYSEKNLLNFVSLVILVSSVAQCDFAQILLFVEVWEKKLKVLLCLIQPFYLLLENSF